MAKDLINLEDSENAMNFLQMFCKSAFCPKAYIDRPADAFIACAVGRTLGMSAYSSLQHIAVINGRPCIWGDGLKALVMNRCTDFVETFDDETFTATCTIKRKGIETPITATFSYSDAERAGLTKRQVWTQYPKRMIQMRARSFAIRDAFPDVLNGIITKEEAQDYPADSDATLSLETMDNYQVDTKKQEKETKEPQQIEQKQSDVLPSKKQSKTEKVVNKLKKIATPPVLVPQDEETLNKVEQEQEQTENTEPKEDK